MPEEPFPEKLQRQSRMDGGEDDDGSLREFVLIVPSVVHSLREFVLIGRSVVQPHLLRERNRAAAGYRMQCIGNKRHTKLGCIHIKAT